MQDDLKIDSYFSRMLSRPPQAIAQLAGDVSHPNLSGTVKFYQLGRGVLLSACFTRTSYRKLFLSAPSFRFAHS